MNNQGSLKLCDYQPTFLTDISKILLPDSLKKCYTKDKQNIRDHKGGWL